MIPVRDVFSLAVDKSGYYVSKRAKAEIDFRRLLKSISCCSRFALTLTAS